MAALLAMVLIVIALPACGSSASAPAGQTFKTLADAGAQVYSDACGVCHGNNGQPADKYTVLLWSEGSTLGSYHGITFFTDARGMLDYMTKEMPLQTPGSLTNRQYTELLAYILVQADIVSPSTAFDANNLSSISIP